MHWICLIGLGMSAGVVWFTLRCAIGLWNMRAMKLISSAELHWKIVGVCVVVVFFIVVIYYLLAFLVSWMTAEWHYCNQKPSVFRGLWVVLRYHLGSVTFAAIIMPIMIPLRILVQSTHQR